jgi:hypothetical protein
MRQIAETFFAARRDARWLDAAHLLDLEAFESIRTQDVRNYRLQKTRKPITPDLLQKYDPSLPREVAVYQAQQSNKLSEETDLLGLAFADVPSVDSLAALPVAEAAARWLEAKDPRWRMARTRSRRGTSSSECPLRPEAIEKLKLPIARIVGLALGASNKGASNEVAYVLYRDWPWALGQSPMSPAEGLDFPPSILTLTRRGGKWRIFPSETNNSYGESFSVDCGTGTGSPPAN